MLSSITFTFNPPSLLSASASFWSHVCASDSLSPLNSTVTMAFKRWKLLRRSLEMHPLFCLFCFTMLATNQPTEQDWNFRFSCGTALISSHFVLYDLLKTYFVIFIWGGGILSEIIYYLFYSRLSTWIFKQLLLACTGTVQGSGLGS